ncbi:MAG: peptide chain release factor N(5)-glutamine methyltransferase [Actinomycetota bacterium]|nr:peptide chain release factor N(5)-glutamine methyltransferase [Actinomycetota bacterium]
MTWRTLLGQLESALDKAEARRIVERASGYDGAELWAHLDEDAPAQAVDAALSMTRRRAAGEPLQYVVGGWGFRRLDLFLDRRVLIPRPETETVVEVAMAELAPLGAGRRRLVADLGTGSGAIALSIAAESPRVTVWATDVSEAALAVARANVAGAGSPAGTRVRLLQGHWWDPLPSELAGTIDLVVSNPPYIAAAEDLPDEVAEWEPAAALVSGPTGLEAVEAIVGPARHWLARPGRLVVEIAPHQSEAAIRLARDAGFEEAEVVPDLAGRPRVLVGRV